MTDDAATTPGPLTTGGLRPELLLAQEQRLVAASFSEEDALRLGLLLLERASARSLPVTLEVRHGERTVFRAALPGSKPDQDGWIARKARVVRLSGHSTMYERVRHEAAGTTFEAATGLPESEYAAHGGGFPVVVEGELAGILLVSGLPQVDDHAFAVDVLGEFLAARSAGGPTP